VVSVKWLPRLKGGSVQMTRVFGIDGLTGKVSDELQDDTALGKYGLKPGGGFNWRFIAGTRQLSEHSLGIALDINVGYSDYWRWAKPVKGTIPYKNRIPLAIAALFERYGFIWGGRSYHYDTMHFEYRPELLAYAKAKGCSAGAAAIGVGRRQLALDRRESLVARALGTLLLLERGDAAEAEQDAQHVGADQSIEKKARQAATGRQAEGRRFLALAEHGDHHLLEVADEAAIGEVAELGEARGLRHHHTHQRHGLWRREAVLRDHPERHQHLAEGFGHQPREFGLLGRIIGIAGAGNDGGKQVVLALGVAVQGHDRDVGASRDRLHRTALVAQAKERIARRRKDLRTLAGHQLGLGMFGRPILHWWLTSIRE
jgi:hypothetical protein